MKRKRGRATYNKRIALYIFYAEYYLSIKDYPTAERYCSLSEKLILEIDAEESVDDAKILSLRAHIAETHKQYGKALLLTNKSCELLAALSNTPIELNEILTLKARLLIHLGRGEESIALYDSIQKRTADILNREFNAHLDELRTQYEVDKITADKERHRSYFLFSLLGCLLLTLALGIWIYYSRTIIRKNRELVRKNQQWAGIENRDDAEDMADIGEENNIEKTEGEKGLPIPKVADNTDKIVMEKIRNTLAEGAYKDSLLTLDTLAEQLGYHANYVSSVINRCTGKNFKTCINEYRVKEAIRLLSDKEHPNSVSIDSVIADSGFNDRSNFYRVFRKMTGLSPGDFNKSIPSDQLKT